MLFSFIKKKTTNAHELSKDYARTWLKETRLNTNDVVLSLSLTETNNNKKTAINLQKMKAGEDKAAPNGLHGAINQFHDNESSFSSEIKTKYKYNCQLPIIANLSAQK